MCGNLHVPDVDIMQDVRWSLYFSKKNLAMPPPPSPNLMERPKTYWREVNNQWSYYKECRRLDIKWKRKSRKLDPGIMTQPSMLK